MPEKTRGYLTLAAGSPRFLEMAVDWALSLREHTRYPIAIATDEATAESIDAACPGVFDAVRIVPREFRDGRALKYGIAEASPFDETVFVDADCIVLGPLDHAFEALRTESMAFLGEMLGRDDNENHHGFSTRRLMRTFGLERYLKTNSGFFAFRTEEARPIMQAFRTCFLEEARPRLRFAMLRGAWLGDEIAIGIVGGREGLGTLPKPAEMFWPAEIEALELDDPVKPLLHFIWPIPAAAYRRLMTEARLRRERAGIAFHGTGHWDHEQEKLERMARRVRLLRRLRIW